MKRILTILFLFLATSLHAQNPETLMKQGNEAFKNADYTQAVSSYEAILNDGYENADLYYNLGNAYYRLEEFGMAILNYERALRLKPNFRDARQNLELAQSKTEDQITPLPEFFLSKWAKSFIGWFSPTGWRVALLIILAFLGALLVFFFLCNDYRWRKNALIGSILATCLLLIAIASAIASSASFNHHNKAVVTEPMIVIKGSPEASSIDKLVLHEGTELDIEETLGDWHKIRIADGNTGWVQSDEITII